MDIFSNYYILLDILCILPETHIIKLKKLNSITNKLIKKWRHDFITKCFIEEQIEFSTESNRYRGTINYGTSRHLSPHDLNTDTSGSFWPDENVKYSNRIIYDGSYQSLLINMCVYKFNLWINKMGLVKPRQLYQHPVYQIVNHPVNQPVNQPINQIMISNIIDENDIDIYPIHDVLTLPDGYVPPPYQLSISRPIIIRSLMKFYIDTDRIISLRKLCHDYIQEILNGEETKLFLLYIIVKYHQECLVDVITKHLLTNEPKTIITFPDGTIKERFTTNISRLINELCRLDLHHSMKLSTDTILKLIDLNGGILTSQGFNNLNNIALIPEMADFTNIVKLLIKYCQFDKIEYLHQKYVLVNNRKLLLEGYRETLDNEYDIYIGYFEDLVSAWEDNPSYRSSINIILEILLRKEFNKLQEVCDSSSFGEFSVIPKSNDDDHIGFINNGNYEQSIFDDHVMDKIYRICKLMSYACKSKNKYIKNKIKHYYYGFSQMASVYSLRCLKCDLPIDIHY